MPSFDVQLLWQLLQSRQYLANVSPDEVHRLRDVGCRFETHPTLGVRLLEAGLGTWVDLLETVVPGAIVYGRTNSTQDVARELVDRRGLEVNSYVVAAHEQERGRGRLGRQWVTPPGTAATFSLIYMLDGDDAATIDRVTFAASVAVARAIEPLVGHEVQIKWPNDIWINGKKIAGILVETLPTPHGLAAIIGVGINVNLPSDQLPVETATSFAVLEVDVDRLCVIVETVRELDQAINVTSTDALLIEWRQRSVLLHHTVELQNNGKTIRGEVVDLDPRDGLIVRTAYGAMTHLPAATTTVVKE